MILFLFIDFINKVLIYKNSIINIILFNLDSIQNCFFLKYDLVYKIFLVSKLI